MPTKGLSIKPLKLIMFCFSEGHIASYPAVVPGSSQSAEIGDSAVAFKGDAARVNPDLRQDRNVNAYAPFVYQVWGESIRQRGATGLVAVANHCPWHGFGFVTCFALLVMNHPKRYS